MCTCKVLHHHHAFRAVHHLLVVRMKRAIILYTYYYTVSVSGIPLGSILTDTFEEHGFGH